MKNNIEEDVIQHLLEEITLVAIYNDGVCKACNDYFVTTMKKHNHALIKKDITDILSVLKSRGDIKTTTDFNRNRVITVIEKK